MSHSPVPPSSSAQRIQCPLSASLQLAYPQEDTPEAAEGEAAHWAGAEQLAGRLMDVGVIAPNGVVLDEEMLQAADTYSGDVQTLVPGAQLHIEQRVNIPRVHAQSWGTPDCWALVGHHLYIWDFKYGHRYVDAFENKQMIEYAAGLSAGLSEHTRVTMTIVQPRSYHRDGPVRRWTTTLLDLRAHINVASNAAHEALGPSPRARVGPECRDCTARHVCPTLQASGYEAAQYASGVQPLELPANALALELRTLREARDLLDARVDGLEQQATAMLRAGKYVPGWALEHGAGREKWLRPAAEVAAIGQAMGVTVTKPLAVVTPAQAREAGLDPALVASMSTRPAGSPKLVPADAEQARRVFG